MNLFEILTQAGVFTWFQSFVRDVLKDDEFVIGEAAIKVGNATWVPGQGGGVESFLGDGTRVVRGLVTVWHPPAGSMSQIIAIGPDEEDSDLPWRAFPLAMVPDDIRLKVVELIRAAGATNFNLPALTSAEWNLNRKSSSIPLDIVFEEKEITRRDKRTFTVLRAYYHGKRVELANNRRRHVVSPVPKNDLLRKGHREGRNWITDQEGTPLRCVLIEEHLHRVIVVWTTKTSEEAKALDALQLGLQLGSVVQERTTVSIDPFAALGLDRETATEGDIARTVRALKRVDNITDEDTVVKAMKAAGVTDLNTRDARLRTAEREAREIVRSRPKPQAEKPEATEGRATTPTESSEPKVLLKDTFATLGLTEADATEGKIRAAERKLKAVEITTEEAAAADVVCVAIREAYAEHKIEVSLERVLSERNTWIGKAASASRGALRRKAKGDTGGGQAGSDEDTTGNGVDKGSSSGGGTSASSVPAEA